MSKNPDVTSNGQRVTEEPTLVLFYLLKNPLWGDGSTSPTLIGDLIPPMLLPLRLRLDIHLILVAAGPRYLRLHTLPA